jgi:hypothetical protein
MSVSLERLVRNQLVFREVNDRIREVTERFDVVRHERPSGAQRAESAHVSRRQRTHRRDHRGT